MPVIVALTAAGLERGFVAVGGLLYGETTLLLGESYETRCGRKGEYFNVVYIITVGRVAHSV